MAERKIDFIFNSEINGQKKFQLANGHISETAILFEKEKMLAVIYAQGKVELYNADGELVEAKKLPAVDSGKQVYDEVRCQVNGDLIELQFPVYEWIDTYPNCDGEYDRWITREIGCKSVTFAKAFKPEPVLKG